MAPLQRRFRKSPWSSANPVDARLVDSRNCSIEISARAFETNQEIASFCQKWHSLSTHKRHTLRNRKILPASPWLPASFNAVRSFNPSKAERPSRKGSALFSGFAFSPVDRGSRAMSDESAGSGRRLAVRPHARAANRCGPPLLSLSECTDAAPATALRGSQAEKTRDRQLLACLA